MGPVVPVRVLDVGPVPLGSVASEGVPPDDDGPEVGVPEVGSPEVGVLPVVGLGAVAEVAEVIEVGELDGSESPWLISDRSSAQAERSNRGRRR